MTTTAEAFDDDSVDRAFAYGMLSLDVVRPAHDALGLAALDGDLLVKALRRGRLDAEADGCDVAAIVRETRRALVDAFGTSTADRLDAWLQRIWLDGHRDDGAYIWRAIVSYGLPEKERDLRPIPDVVVRLREAMMRWPPFPRTTTVPESAWDRAMFDELGYDPHAATDEDEAPSLMSWVKCRASHARFCCAWGTVLGASSDREGDLAALWRFRRFEAVLLDIPLERVPRPGDWYLPSLEPDG